MCLINDQCNFIKPLNYIWNWKSHSSSRGMLHRRECQGDINQPNGIQRDRLSAQDRIRLFFMLLSFSFCGSISVQLLFLTWNPLWINVAVNNLLFYSRFLFLFSFSETELPTMSVWNVGSHIQCAYLLKSWCFVYRQSAHTHRRACLSL